MLNYFVLKGNFRCPKLQFLVWHCEATNGIHTSETIHENVTLALYFYSIICISEESFEAFSELEFLLFTIPL